MFCYFCGEEKICFLTKFCSKGFKWLFEASFVKEDIRWFCVFDSTSENKQSNRITVKKRFHTGSYRIGGLVRDSQMR